MRANPRVGAHGDPHAAFDRQLKARLVIADQLWKTVLEEDKQTVELLDLSRQILSVTLEVRSLACRSGGGSRPSGGDRPVN